MAAILIIIAAIGFVVVLIALLLFCCAGCCAPQRGAALRAIASVIYRVQRIRRGRVGAGTTQVMPEASKAKEGKVFSLSHAVGHGGSGGHKRGYFRHPRAACEMLGDNDRRLILVADTGNHRLEVVTLDGLPVGKDCGSFGTMPGQFDVPSAVARDAEATFVADSNNHRIQKIGGHKLPGFPQCHAKGECAHQPDR